MAAMVEMRGSGGVMAVVWVAILAALTLLGQGASAQSWTGFLTPDVFNGFFPNRNAFYTYDAFTASAGAYPAFGTTGSLDDQKRELAAFLANVNQETGGLQFISEINPPNDYCDSTSTQYPCAPGKSYMGRGPIQISFNFNYGECGSDLGLDLLNNPDLVAQDDTVTWQTGLWFWMKRNCHGAITASPPSFSGTIRIINGGIECGQPAGSLGNQQMQNRVTYYQQFCQTLGVDPGTDLTC